MIEETLKEILYFGSRILKRLFDDHCATNAAALAFTTLLALVPLAAVVFSTLSIFPVFENWVLGLENFIYENFVPASGEIVRTYLQQFADKTRELTAIGVLFLVTSALFMLATIEDTFNRIWRVNKGRSWSYKFTAYWAVLTLGPILLGASLSLSSKWLTANAEGNDGVSVLLSWLPFCFEIIAFTMLYSMMPNCVVRLLHAFIGGIVAAVLFEISKAAFAYFIFNMANYEIVYGALATIPIFLIWLYLSWFVVLIGAEFTAAMDEDDDA